MTRIVSSTLTIDELSIQQSKGEVIRYAEKDLSVKIGRFLFEEGIIEFEQRDIQENGWIRKELTARLGVASKKEFEEEKRKVEEYKNQGAIEFLEQLWEKVSNWGSYYGDRMIDKGMVYKLAKESLRDIEK